MIATYSALAGVGLCALTRRARAFNFTFFVLVLYTVFAQIAYVYYPAELHWFSGGQYYGKAVFVEYWAFVLLASAASVLCFLWLGHLFDDREWAVNVTAWEKLIARLVPWPRHAARLSLAAVPGLLLVKLATHFDVLSYQNQAVMKQDRLWFFAYGFCSVVLFAQAMRARVQTEVRRRAWAWLAFSSMVLVFLYTAVRAGQRIAPVTTIFGFTAFLSPSARKDGEKRSWWRTVLPVLTLGAFAIFVQAMRHARAEQLTLMNVMCFIWRKPSLALEWLHPKGLVFQDWAVPSLSLATSIHHRLIIPDVLLKANLGNVIPLVHAYPPIAELLSRIIDPQGVTGYGYYILTEGYNLAGFLGFLPIGVVFAGSLWLLEKVFCTTDDSDCNTYMAALLRFIALDIVRGGVLALMKGVLMYIVPGFLLYVLAVRMVKTGTDQQAGWRGWVHLGTR